MIQCRTHPILQTVTLFVNVSDSFCEQLYTTIGSIIQGLCVIEGELPGPCGLLGEKDVVPLLDGDSVTRKFIVWRESGYGEGRDCP